MTVLLATDIRNAMCDAVTSAIGNAATVEIRTGSPPATIATADSGTLLGTLTMGTPAAAGASGGVLTMGTITGDSSADATGTAGHYRVKTSGGTVKMQGTISASGGGGDMIINTTSIVTGGPIEISSWTMTASGG